MLIVMHVFRKLNIEELWIKFGMGRNKRWLPVHEYVASLGDDVCAALPFWYAFTGCNPMCHHSVAGARRYAGMFGNHTVA